MNTFKMDTREETRPNSGVMLPVVELVIAIGLFTVISIFIVKFFTSANTMSRQADDLSKGLIKAESAIELAKSFSPEEVAKELGGKLDDSKESKEIVAYYDKDWMKTEPDKDWKYSLSVQMTGNANGNGVLWDINVTVNRNDKDGDDNILLGLKGAKYVKGGK